MIKNLELKNFRSKKNPELKKAIELEMKGYSKPDMTRAEIEQERLYFDQQVYSLDFM